jgi:hypothetical protein
MPLILLKFGIQKVDAANRGAVLGITTIQKFRPWILDISSLDLSLLGCLLRLFLQILNVLIMILDMLLVRLDV